jgi:hypothetical protein
MWIATLSNGERANETNPIPNELSPWQKLLQRCTQENVRITHLELKLGQTSVGSLRNAEGYFQAYETISGVNTKQHSTYQGIGSVIGDKVYIVWVSLDGRTVWQDARPLNNLYVHTDLRQIKDVIG